MKIKFLDGSEKEFDTLVWVDLSNADLSNADLSNADLRWADLRRADLSNADLSNADLSNADLRRADLSNADLSNADLRMADLRRADLSNADLRRADLDFSAWPLWCGSLGVKIDHRIAYQLMYHVLSAMKSIENDEEVNDILKDKKIIDFANRFDKVKTGECKELKQRGDE